MDYTGYIEKTDPEVAEIIKQEVKRNNENLLMIASENYADEAVMQAQGSVFTNKYAEGYPEKRFYQGTGYCDDIEKLAIERAKELFGAEHANVQPLAGSQANQAVYLGFLKPNDTLMGMDLAAGGHLTHGSPASSSGKLYNAISYPVDRETFLLDYDEIAKIAKKARPKIIIAGASAYSRHIDFKKFREIADESGALLLADIAHYAGLVAAKLFPDPVPYCDFVTTTTHKTLKGPRGGLILCREKHAKKIDSAVFPGLQGGPFMHAIAAKAVCFKQAKSEEFKNYQKQVVENARALAKSLAGAGYNVLTSGTDTHMVIVDLRPDGPTGKEAAIALEKAGITVNKNGVPFDDKSPFVTSGIRIGTPAITARGMKQEETGKIAEWIDKAVKNRENENILGKIKEEKLALCRKFPIYK